jgi:NAD(P)H-nitrite reductase large subunit
MQVDYRSGMVVTGVYPREHRLHVMKDISNHQSESLEYDRLVIATGSRLHAPLSGVDLPGVYNFKSLSTAEALIGRVRRGEAHSAMVIGAGFIGMEITLLLRELGVAVTQVEMLDQVMPAMLDADSAAFALRAMRERGVDVRLNTRATAILDDGRAKSLLLDTGEELQADLYIAATGVRPNLEMLTGSGIIYKRGVCVDDHLRTSAADVYAAGDVIESPDWLTGEVFVHAIFPNAVEQGRVVGLNLTGFEVRYEGAEQMNSLKHLGIPLVAVGLKQGDQKLQTRQNGSLRTMYLHDDRLVGYQLVGDIRNAGALRTLLLRREKLGKLKDHLLEPNFGQSVLAWQSIAGM